MLRAPMLMGHDPTRLLQYWQSLPRRGKAPRRASIDPAALGVMLRDLIMLRFERQQSDVISLDLVGDSHISRWGGNYTFKNFLSLIAPEHREHASSILRRLIAHPCAAHGLMFEGVRRQIVELEFLALPLADHDDTIHSAIVFARMCRPLGPAFAGGGDEPFVVGQVGRFIDLGFGVPDVPVFDWGTSSRM